MNIVLLGPPGAGKGTQSGAICEKFGLLPISTGNLLRKAVREQTKLGQIAAEKISKGEMVSDDIVIGLVSEFIAGHPDTGFLFDGFPRTAAQAEALSKLIEIDTALLIDVADEIILQRMGGRRVCEVCGDTYHISANPPKVCGVCDKCGGKLVIREDDKPEIVRHRLEVYHEQTQPIIEYYRGFGKLISVPGDKTPEEVSALVNEALENV